MATILPTGETQFFDANGDPLAGGTVTFYIPGTTTPKDTWQNSGQSILNSNPVTLDSAGRAIIYGSGAYRQIVKDSVGNLIWDQETSEPNAGSISFGGTSSGTANAQALSAAQFSFLDGQIISFVAGLSNTSAMTMSVGGSAPIPVLKNGPSGPVALVANDIVAGNNYFIQYSATLSAFQILLSVSPAVPTGTYLSGYLYGLTLSNNGADATNSIDLSTGLAGSDGVTPVLMTNSATLTKKLNLPWAVGSGNGGWLDGASMPNGTGHAFLIQRSDTGVVDLGFSASLTPTLPANYDRKRRVGSILRESGAIVGFFQLGKYFKRTEKVDYDSASALPSTTVSLSVPTGIRVRPIISGQLVVNASSNIAVSVGYGDGTSATDLFQTAFTGAGGVSSSMVETSHLITNASRQIYISVIITTGSISICRLRTLGWYDDL